MSTKKQQPEQPASVVLKRGEESVEVVSPTLVTKMKSEGWEVVE